jgi:uncharacterized protein (TIGR04255 family)
MARKHNLLPDFSNPPIIEAVLGVEFSPIVNWGIPYFGLYWDSIRAEYPRFEVKQPLRTLIGPKGVVPPADAAFVEFVETPDVRCWFIDESETRLIQLQQERFIINWRKVRRGSGLAYLHYDHNRQTFEQEWLRFNDFLKNQSFETPEAQLCEVTYVNHIERGDGWRSFAELHEVLPILAEFRGDLLSSPEALSVGMQYKIDGGNGQLTIQIQPAIRHEDMKQVIQLTLIARGRPKSSEVSSLLDWFDLGHEYIAVAFREITSDKMRNLWEGNQ